KIDDRATDELVAHYETFNASTAELVETFRQVQEARRRELMVARASGDTMSRQGGRRDALRDDAELRERARRAQRIVGDVQSAKLSRAVSSDRPPQEAIVDFWEDHFSVFSCQGPTRLL